MKIDMSLATTEDVAKLLANNNMSAIFQFADKVVVGGIFHLSITDDSIGECLAKVADGLKIICDKLSSDFDAAKFLQDLENHLNNSSNDNKENHDE